jgi:hypothetical protein
MFGFVKKKAVQQPEEIALFNVYIHLDGLEGPFHCKNKSELLEKAFRINRILNRKPNGNYYVMNSGRLFRGSKDNLLTREGSMNEWEFDHLHYKGSGAIEDIKMDKWGDFHFSRREYTQPLYTLQGLYETLPNLKANTKIKAMEKVFAVYSYENIDEFLLGSLAKNKRTRLKLVENKYRNAFLRDKWGYQ